jgi:HAE1 family hydrophobic/amphiphilic exporter-1
MRHCIIIFGVVLLSWPASAQVQVDHTVGSRLTLEEAEARALDRNPQIAEAYLGIESADFTVAQRAAAFSSTVTTLFNQRGQTNPNTSQLDGTSTSSVTNNASTFNTTLAKPLERGGGQVSVGFNNGRTSTSNLFSNFNPSYSSSVTANFTQPLLRGFGIDNTRQQLAQAQIDRDTADVVLRQQLVQIVANVRRAYWELVYTVDALELARQSLALAERQLDDNRLRLELGTMAQIDVLTSQAEVATRTQAVVQAEGSWRAAQISLKQLVVADTDDPLWGTTVVPTSRPTYEASPDLDVGSAIGRALGNRTDIEQLRRQGDGLDLSLRLLADQRKPAVNLSLGLTYNGVGGTRLIRASQGFGSSSTGSIPGDYLDALSTLGSFDFPTWTVGFNVSLPLNNSAAEAAEARGRTQRRQVDARLRTAALQAAANITRLADQVVNADQQVQAATVARQLAEQRLDLENVRLEVGLSTTFLVLQAQRDLATAQTAELRGLLDYRRAMVDFEQAQEAP